MNFLVFITFLGFFFFNNHAVSLRKQNILKINSQQQGVIETVDIQKQEQSESKSKFNTDKYKGFNKQLLKDIIEIQENQIQSTQDLIDRENKKKETYYNVTFLESQQTAQYKYKNYDNQKTRLILLDYETVYQEIVQESADKIEEKLEQYSQSEGNQFINLLQIPEISTEVKDRLTEKNLLQMENQQNNEFCESETLQVPVLTGIPEIGELYDAKTETVLYGERLWSSDNSRSKMTKIQKKMPNTQFLLKHSEKTTEKFSKAEANTKFRLSFFFFSVTKRGRYNNEQKSSSKIQRGELSYKIQTEIHSVEDFSRILYNEQQFQRTDISHVISGIAYGGKIKVIFDYKKQTSSDRTDSGGFVSGALGYLANALRSAGEVRISNDERRNLERFKITTESDVPIPGPQPINTEQAINYMKKAPQALLKDPNTLGTPQFIILTPICSILKNVNQIQQYATNLFKKMSDQLANSFLREIEDLEQTKLELNGLQEDYDKAPQIFLTQEIKDNYEQFKNGFEEFTVILKDIMEKIIVATKSTDTQEIQKLTQDMNTLKSNSLYSVLKIQSFIKEQTVVISNKVRAVDILDGDDPSSLVIIQKSAKKELGEDDLHNNIIIFTTVDQVMGGVDENVLFFANVRDRLKPQNTRYFVVFMDYITSYNTKQGQSYIEYWQPQGKRSKVQTRVTDNYKNYNKLLCSVLLNPEQAYISKQKVYVGFIDQQEIPSGKGSMYLGGKQVLDMVQSSQNDQASNKLVYSGYWTNGQFSGDGKLYKDGKIHCSGEFFENKSLNYLECSDGNYKGPFNDLGQKHGIGIQAKPTQNAKDRVCKVEFSEGFEVKEIECCKLGESCDSV